MGSEYHRFLAFRVTLLNLQLLFFLVGQVVEVYKLVATMAERRQEERPVSY